MQLATLQIERFGSRSHVRLDRFSDRLNVVFGPTGSGKQTIMDFIRWVLYGNPDGSSASYLHAIGPRASGSLDLSSSTLQQTVSRTDDGSPNGRVSVQHPGFPEVADAYFKPYSNSRITGVDYDEFRHVFSIDFDNLPTIEGLIGIGETRGFGKTVHDHPYDKIQNLESRLTQQRQRSNRFANRDTVPALHQRRQSILKEIDSLEQHKRDRLHDLHRQRAEWISELDQRQNELNSVQAWVQQIDATIQTRREQLEAAAREIERARESWDNSRRQNVEEIDFQIQHWHQVLDSIRSRFATLKSKVGNVEPSLAFAVDDDSELRSLMRSFGYHVDDIEQDFIRPYGTDQKDHLAEHEYLRSIFGTALYAMREDVHRLTEQVRNYKALTHHNEYEQEIRHLKRCETELTELIDTLSKRRDALVAQPDWGRNFYSTTHWTRTDHHPMTDDSTAVTPWYQVKDDRAPERQPVERLRIRGIDPVLESRLQHLYFRRDQVAPQALELETTIRDLQARLSSLDKRFTSEDDRIEQLRRELNQLDEQYRWSEEYERSLREIKATEEELNRLRSGYQPSGILQHASSLLRRLTNDAFTTIERDFHSHQQVVIIDSIGRRIAYRDLAGESKNAVYLSVALALVHAYHRRGVHHPVLMHHLVHLHSHAYSVLVDVLDEFARNGNQIVLFTNRESLLNRLHVKNAKIFMLSEPVVPRPVPVSPSTTLPTVVPEAPEPESVLVPQTKYEWVSHWERPDNLPSEEDVSTVAVRKSAPTKEVITRPDPAAKTIGLGSPLDSISTLDAEFVRWFRELDVVTVSHFLQLDPEETAIQLKRYQVLASQIYRWQSEVLLQVYVGIDGIDSQILAECGIDDPEELAMSDVDELQRRINAYLADHAVRARFPHVSQFDRTQLFSWVDRARRSGFRRRSDHRSQTQPIRTEHAENANYIRTQTDKRAKKEKEDGPRAVRRTNSAKTKRNSQAKAAKSQLRFYLDLNDPIVDAPSIGPKTAERFHAIGVKTISEFLDIDPKNAASRIDYSRITSDIIREWQLQTRLVHQIPNLRGHDAQILVACNVSSAETLARADASTLFKDVKRFCNTTEGKRVLRSGKKPDLAEVTAWINWANQARELVLV